MVEEYPLDVILVEGKDYETGPREHLIVEKLGTDATTATHLKIDEKPLGDLYTHVAPLYHSNANELGPLDLGPLFYVVPPETSVVVEGASGAKMRLIGKQIKLGVGEELATVYMDRFKAQPNHYITYELFSKTLPTGTDIAVDQEIEIGTLTPKTIEKCTFNNIVEASIDAITVSWGELAVLLQVDDVPVYFLLEKTKTGAIDFLACPRPPKDTVNFMPYSLKVRPVVVEGDHTLKVLVRNVKGAAITVGAGVTPIIRIDLVYEYLKTI